jgi:AAHS family 4-hydroxybenzoate transporter-like MFS transporter
VAPEWVGGGVFVVAALAALCAALAAFSLGRLAGLGGSGKAAPEERLEAVTPAQA